MPLHGEIVVIKRNGSDGTHFPLTAKSCLFGRKTECDIRIQLPHVSKEHCKVDVKNNGEVFVTNLSTVNPTQINGTIVKQPVQLKHGDVITIIDRSFRFEKSSVQQGKRRSTGLDSETFKAFATNKSSDTNETLRIDSLLTSKTQRKSEGNITRTTHSRRSLQISSSSEPKREMSPFGELYEMLKSEVKQNGKTPVKDKSRSPKNVALKRSLQIQENAQTPVAQKRTPRRSQSSDSPKTSPKEVVVKQRSASAGRVREASRSPKTSIKAVNESFQGESEQTKRRSSAKQASQSVPQEQVAPVVNGSIQKRSPRRSAGAEQSQVLTLVQSTPKNAKTPDSTPRRRSNQSVPEQPVLKETSPRSKSPTQGRRSASLDNVQKGTPNKPPVTGGKTSEEPRQSQRKRRSDELSLPDPPPKRKRVSFGGHLSPELFDKRLPPNSPLKKGATPARRSLSLNSPRTLIRKSFGSKQSVIREVFERSASASITPSTPTSPSKYSSVKSSPAVTESGKSQVSKSPNKQSALIKTPAKSPSPRRPVSATSPDVAQSAAPLTPVKNSPAKSAVKTSSTPSKRMSGQKSPAVNSPVKSPSKNPKKTPSKSLKGLVIKSKTPVKAPSPGAKMSPVAKTPSPAKKTPVAKTPSPAKKTPVAKTPTPTKRSPVAKTPSPAKRAKTLSPAKKTPVAKTSTPAKRSKTPSPAKTTPVAKKSTPAKRSRTPSPAKKTPVAKTSTPAKRSKTPSPAKKTPVAKTSTPAKRSKTPSPAKKTPVAKTSTPAKRSKTPSPAKKTPVAKTSTPAKRSKTPSPAKKTPVAKTSTPAKRSKTPSPAKMPTPAKRSKTPSPAKKIPVAKTPSPTKRSPGAKTPTPAKRSPGAKTPTPAKRSPGAKTPTPAKRSPGAKTPTPAKRSPGAKTPTPAKRSPGAKTPTPAKRSPGAKTPTPAKRSPGAKTPTPAKRSPGAKTPTPAKRSPGAKTPTPAKRSPGAKTPTPAKRSPGAKTPTPAKRSPGAKTPTPAKRSPGAKTPTPAKRSPGAKTPTPATPATPYMKGRFSVSRIGTPPQVTVQSELLPSRTPNKSRKSLSMKKTPRRSRKLEALELIRSRRRSGATEANLLVSKTWADVVKIGVAKSQKKIEEISVRKTVATKKKLKHKTPMKKIKDLASTGHADSPATILVGRAHTRMVNLTGYVPKVVRNQAVKLDTALNENFTGVAELFSTPVNKQRKSNRVESSKNDTPSSTVVEVSVMQTPEGSGEMVVSPLNSKTTTRRKQYGQDAVSRLLHSPVSPELLKDDSATFELAKEKSKSQKNERKSVGLSAVKRIMRTPKQKGGQVTDPHALRKLLRTPKETASPQASSRRSTNLEVLGMDIVNTPKQKGVPENFSGLQRIMKTPKQKAEPVEVLTAVKRIMRTPKEKVQPVEDMIGIKRVMRTPKEKSQPVEDMVGIKRVMRSPKERGQPVEDMVGIKRIMSTPKERGQPVEDYALNHLMKTPEENIHSAESTRPIEEIFGMRNLIKTPPKPPVGKEVASTDPSKWSANSSGNAVRRGRPSKRLNLQVYSSSGDTAETVQSPIVQEVVTQSSQEVVKSVPKRGRLSKSQSISSSELPNEHVSDVVTSPRHRGRPSPASKRSLSASDAEVTSPTQRGRPIAVTESPKESVPVADGKITSPTRKGRPSTPVAAPKESASDAIVEVTPRRKGRQSSIAKESVSTSDAEVTSQAKPETPKITTEASEESASDAVSEVTSPRRRGRQSSNYKASQPISSSHVDVSSPSRRGRPSSTAKESVSDSEVTSSTQSKTPKALAEAPKDSASNSVSEAISQRRRGRTGPTSRATEEPLSASDAEVTSPRRKGRQSSAARESLSVSDTEVTSSTQHEKPHIMAETPKEFTFNAVMEGTSPRRSGRPSSTAKAPKESLVASDAEVTSPSRRGRSSSSAEALKSPIVADGQKTPTSHKKISTSKVASPGESLTVTDSSNSEVVSPRSRGRPSSTGKDENPKETVPIADGKVTSPTRRGRPSTSAVINESVPSTSPTTVEVLVESLLVSKTASPARRGRPKKDRAVVPEESVPTAKSKLTSPTRNKPNSPSEDPSEPVSDSHSRITKDPIPVVEGKASSKTRRARQKTKVDLPEEPSAPEVQITRGSRSKGTVEKAELSVSVVRELPTTQTRRGRPKASAQVAKVSPTVPEVDVSSPTRGSRSKGIAEAPKDTVPVFNDVAVSQKRRGRPKVAEVTAESIVSEVAAPTRSNRSKDMANESEVSVPAVEEVMAQKRRGRVRKADVSKESGAVSEVTSSGEELDQKSTEDGVSEVASPTRKGRSRNTEVSKETAQFSDGVTSSKRKPETTEGELDLPEVPSEGANEKAAKSNKKTVRQSAKKPSKQAPEPEDTIQVAEKKTQLPQRGRRKAAQNEPVPEVSGDPNSSLGDKQPEGLTGNTSPVARRGGRRRNAEELSRIESVTKPKTSKQETRSRSQSKSKGLTEENEMENSDASAPEEPVKSPEPKSPKKSPARQTKELAIELPVESQPKSMRERPSKKVNVTEASNVASSETLEPKTEAPQKRVPARGRSRTARDVNVSASDAGEPTRGSSRASRRNLTLSEDSSASLEEQNKPVSVDKESSTRGTRGKKASYSSETNSSPEVKGRRIAKGRILKNVEEQTITKSKTKSVQWHPLLDTDIQSTTNAVSDQDSNEVSPRASRLKGKTRADASEPQVTAKRSRRGNQAEAEEPPASTSSQLLTVSEDVPSKRGRKANVQRKGEAIDTKATAESTVSTEVVQAIPQRGRRGAPSKVEIENNEVHNAEPSTSRRQRGVSARGTPSEQNKSTQSHVKSQKGGAGQEKAEDVSSKSTRGVKRKLPNAEVNSAPVSEPDAPSDTSESVLVETENIPAGRGRKNQRNTKTQKGDVQQTVPEKQTVTADSPAKRRKTEAATTAAQKKSSRQTSKLEKEKQSAATKTRTSTRSRK
ncbi:proliferation marker protein Ki-67 isoform X2 [Hyla sarda]|uniref:proliferation marker protein Ki-67 isoform X2 n=1 Tax=Hyla sarda TaxID=327740 RepID=UPI0024C43B74|nr:proliferation marker protein Ki-67 isoform X2 [Hyla sarda]